MGIMVDAELVLFGRNVITMDNDKPRVQGVAIKDARSLYMAGSIEMGKLADLAVLAEDLTQVDQNKIKDIPVMATMVGGKFFYKKTEMPPLRNMGMDKYATIKNNRWKEFKRIDPK